MKEKFSKKFPRFILLDDDSFALAIEKMIIGNYCRSAEIITFSAAREAIKYFDAGDFMVKDRNTVFITDLHMPEMNGFELLDRMEDTFSAFRERLHIFVLSATVSRAEIQRVSSHRCVTGFLHKPISKTKIEKLIDTLQFPS